jgi:hypothetical protein
MDNERMAFRAGCFVGTGSNGKRFVYVQVPKVACTSIKQALLPAFEVEWQEGDRTVHNSLRKSKARVSKRTLSRPRLREAYRFSFVRNPFDRLVSAYFSKVRSSEKNLLRQPGVYTGMPFGEFAEAVCASSDEESDWHVRPQWTFFDGVRMDFVGRMEQMRKDWARVAGVIGVPPDLPHSNKSGTREGYRAFYDDELAGRVAERYRTDLEMFGYSY